MISEEKEAIEELKILKENYWEDDGYGYATAECQKTITALDMAIEALEPQPCEDWYDVPSNEMTLEQARQAVKDLRKKLAEYLEQQPCEDCISRQAVLALPTSKTKTLSGEIIEEEVNIELIKALPSVVPKEKTAEWYEENGCEGACDGYMSAGVICSQCGEVFCGYIGDYNFCPNCGAKMQEVEE